MTLMRGLFLAAFMLITIGTIEARNAVTPLFNALGGRSGPSVVAAREIITVVVTAPPSTQGTRPQSRRRAAFPTVTPTVESTSTPTRSRVRHRRAPVRPRRPSTPLPTPSPTPTTTAGAVSLDRYWVGSLSARGGATVSIGYVIDNGTGRTERIMLGASIKRAGVLNWLTGSIADPYHDVVATVPRGISTHIRYFTLPARLRPGTYDIAWGLKDALTGHRDALVFAPAALRVTR